MTQWIHVMKRGSTLFVRSVEPGTTVVLGRSTSCSMHLPGKSISRRHATLEVHTHWAELKDLGSRNGTWVEDERLEPGRALEIRDGTCCRIGSNYLVFRRSDRVSSDEALAARAALAPVGYEPCYALGKGSGQPVWAALELKTKRTVAIKFLDWVGSDDEDRKRFLREAHLCSKLRSPNIVRVHRVNADAPIPFMVMELVEGLSLQKWLRVRDTPSVASALGIAAQLARALIVMERQGVVHRDIKPANILMGVDGRALLTDFGIAKDLADARGITLPGSGMGTFAYMAPEQVSGAKDADERADLYGLGATLYTLIAGRAPFTHEPKDIKTLVQKVAHEEPPPLQSLREDCPDDVAKLVTSLLAKDPCARLGPASVVVEHLERLFVAYGGADDPGDSDGAGEDQPGYRMAETLPEGLRPD